MTSRDIKSMVKKMAETETKKIAIGLDQKKEKQRKLLKSAGYMAGNIALFGIACAILPSALSKISGALYKASLKKKNWDDDDWGPVIERKEKPGGLGQPKQATIQKGAGTNGN